ncbi:nuclease-related domain-containing protein [Cytobacillus firmus]|uniref:nuclease-related domain-containing protein n=1 Tax=Cytobacillus firmus TaxID=1399 RepID=UPI00300276E9
MRYLNTRMELTEKEKQHWANLEKGYEGEVKFDLLTEKLTEERLVIHDLLLEVNNSYFQIDTLIISDDPSNRNKKFPGRLAPGI